MCASEIDCARISLAAVVLFTLCFFSQADSSVTRTRTLGDVGVLVRDEANFWLFPSTIVTGPDRVVFELGGNDEAILYTPDVYGFEKWAGGTISFRSKRIGAFWSEASTTKPFAAFNSLPLPLDRKLDLFFGSTTSYGSFGMHLNLASALWRTKTDPGSEVETSITQTQLALGFSGNRVDTRFDYRFAVYDPTGPKITGHALGFRSRFFKAIGDRLVLVPFVDFDLALEKSADEMDTKGRGWSFWLGSGLNYPIGDNDMLVFGLSLLRTNRSNETRDTKSDQTQFDLPFTFGGIESELLKWLKIRFGFQKALRKVIVTDESAVHTTTEETVTEAPFVSTAGIGLEYKRFTADFSFHTSLFKRGPYFLSGAAGTLFNLVSVTYRL